MTGQPAPAPAAPGEVWTNPGDGNAILSPTGRVMLYGTTTARGNLWVGPPNALTPLVYSGEPVSGLPAGCTLMGSNSLDFAIDASGTTAFVGDVSGPPACSPGAKGIFVGTPGSLAKVMRNGEQAPGMATGQLFALASPWGVNLRVGAGRVVFYSPIGTATTGPVYPTAGIFTYSGGVLEKLAFDGDHAAGFSATTAYSSLYYLSQSRASFDLATDGSVVFHSALTHPQGSTDTEYSAVWRAPVGGSPAPIAVGRDLPHTATYISSVILGAAEYQGSPTNGIGQAAFAGSRWNSTLQRSDDGLWLAGASASSPVILSGAAAPGDPGWSLTTPLYPELNDLGRMVFYAGVTSPGGSTEAGLYTGTAAGLTRVARSGLQAPGFPPGKVFQSTSGYAFPAGIAVTNARGEVAFFAYVGDAGHTNIVSALYLWSISKGLELVAKQGDSLEISPGSFAAIGPLTLAALDRSGGSDGRRAWLNNRGEIVFGALIPSIANGRATFIASAYVSALTPACSDSIDNDGDGLTGFPADPGCKSATDPSEKFECEDGLDNDGDGTIDFPADAGCASPTSDLEAAAPIDADGDGLGDAMEASLGTDPNNADSDGDGLSDGAEVNTYLTNPLNVDTDGDGYRDGAEVQAGSNPRNATSVPPPAPVPLTSPLGAAAIAGLLCAALVLARRAHP